MNTSSTSAIRILLMLSALLTAAPAICLCQPKQDMGGWEKTSSYNQLYSIAERDQLKGIVTEILEVIPMPGMSPAVAITVATGDNEPVKVHLGPRWFLDPERMGIKKGDTVKIKGTWAQINGEDIFMASKVKKGDYFELKVRLTKDGTPFWTLTPEELEREKASE